MNNSINLFDETLFNPSEIEIHRQDENPMSGDA